VFKVISPALPDQHIVKFTRIGPQILARAAGKTLNDFVRACLAERGLLDQFEEAREAGWEPPNPEAEVYLNPDEPGAGFEFVED
jgi:hypothetical protein